MIGISEVTTDRFLVHIELMKFIHRLVAFIFFLIVLTIHFGKNVKEVEFTYNYQGSKIKAIQFAGQVRSLDSEQIDCKVVKSCRHIHDYMGHLLLNDSFYHKLWFISKKQSSL